MRAIRDILFETLEDKRPIVLILGQEAWVSRGENDPVLTKALAHLGRSGEIQRGWRGLLGATPVPNSFYDWLTERFERRVAPTWLAALNEISWSATFTSAIDPTLKALLRGPEREPEVVLTGDEMPRAIRSRIRPPLYHLFGHAASHDPKANPPADRRQLSTRRIHHALPLLGRVLDTATTLGLVVVDGFASGRDWLKTEDILGAIGKASPEQVLWFGGQPSLEADEAADFEAAVAARHILVAQERLSTAIAALRATGRLPELTLPESEESGVVSFNSGSRLETTPELRLRVEAVASIVDDAWTAFLPPLGADSEYAAFRRFHGAVEGPRILVEGVRRNFAIERDFEQRLLRQVIAAIDDHARFEAPIIVHGQSGTGKSVALARIVARIREKKMAAVLYAVDRIPQSQEVSSFCESADNAGAKATLIVCDTNRDIESYQDLLRGLRSGGRRVVVLGSQYRIIDNDNVGRQPTYFVEALTKLSKREQKELADLLQPYLSKRPDPEALIDAHILAFLYRFLPPSRLRIGTGLGAEARASEQKIRRHGHKRRVVIPNTQLARQLIEKGFADGYTSLFDDKQSDVLDASDAAGKIIDLVMTAGRLNCSVPVNLLLRAVTDIFGGNILDISNLFRELDLFRWKWADAESSEWLILPRLTLEAELICRRRLGSPEKEAKCLIELIKSVRSAGVDREHERRFLLNLLRQIGPDGPKGVYYRNAYIKVARTLTELRQRFQVVHPSLMLQESVFRRIAVRENMVDDDDDCLLLLEEARDAVQSAIDKFPSGTIAKRTRQSLQVERASLYGYLAHNRAQREGPTGEVWSAYLTARSAIRQAVSATDSYFPLDIGLWTPADLLTRAQLTETQKAELTADIYSIIDQVDPETFSPTQRTKFDIRRMKIGAALQDNTLTKNAYTELEISGSTAGYYLRARELAPRWNVRTEMLDAQRDVERAQSAADFLTERFDKIEHDERCLSLLLECRWIAEMRCRPFRGQRQPLPQTDATRYDLLEIVRALNQASGEASRHVTRYLEAVLTWITGDVHAGIGIFRELANETEYDDYSRIFRRHLITDVDLKPRRFQGRVERLRTEGHWVVRIEALNHQTVDLLSRDFPHHEIAYGRTISDFAIAFNFIGPIADPIRRY